jgi:hypothetical protein
MIVIALALALLFGPASGSVAVSGTVTPADVQQPPGSGH